MTPQPYDTSSNGPSGSTQSPGEAYGYGRGGGGSRCAAGKRLDVLLERDDDCLQSATCGREVIGLTRLLTCLLHPNFVACRYVHLAWAMWERKQRNPELCLQLLKRGSALNPTDPAIYQVWGVGGGGGGGSHRLGTGCPRQLQSPFQMQCPFPFHTLWILMSDASPL